ncbi:radical SAM protein [bacterium]|nr:radical SAM protein [bacterium]
MNKQMIYLKIHGMSCNNHCRHCYYFGGLDKPMMSFEQIKFILEQAVPLKDTFQNVVIQYFDEPTIHPKFMDIFEKQAELDLMWDGFFIPTNGSGLARMSEDGWKRFGKIENIELQLTFYGLGKKHDDFAGRKGAYDDLVKTLTMAARNEISSYCGIVAYPEIVNDLPKIKQEIVSLGHGNGGVGWYISGWQGRGADPKLRPGIDDIEKLRLPIAHFKSEKQHIETILETPDIGARSATETLCNFVSLEIQSDMSVVYGGGCDHAPPPELLPHLVIGNLKEEGFDVLVKKYLEDPPKAFRILDQVTWGELAEKYGDRDNDAIFFINDLVGNKWATQYILDTC